MTLLSFVTVTRNNADGLASTLRSVAGLASVDESAFEVVIADGASTDDTHLVLDEFALRYPWMRVVSAADSGIYDAMNRATLCARGQYVHYLNAGDTLVASPEQLRTILAQIAESKPLWAIARIAQKEGDVRRESLTVPFNRSKLLFGYQSYYHQACFFKTDVVNALGGYNVQWGIAGDLDMITKFAAVAGPQEFDLVIVDYAPGGLSAQHAIEMSWWFHQARVERLAPGNTLRFLSLVLAVAQGLRRHGIRSLRAGLAIRARLGKKA